VDPKIGRERGSQDSGLELYDQEVILGEGRVDLKRALLAIAGLPNEQIT
jgi:hypothetical protein